MHRISTTTTKNNIFWHFMHMSPFKRYTRSNRNELIGLMLCLRSKHFQNTHDLWHFEWSVDTPRLQPAKENLNFRRSTTRSDDKSLSLGRWTKILFLQESNNIAKIIFHVVVFFLSKGQKAHGITTTRCHHRCAFSFNHEEWLTTSQQTRDCFSPFPFAAAPLIRTKKAGENLVAHLFNRLRENTRTEKNFYTDGCKCYRKFFFPRTCFRLRKTIIRYFLRTLIGD